MPNLTRIAIALFAAVVAAGPLYTVDGYDAVSNLISELGAQGARNNFIMIGGFLALAAGLVADGARRMSAASVPFMLFGVFMGLAGLFPHRPMDAALPYDETSHGLHALFANLAGVSVTAGFVWQGIRASGKSARYLRFYLAAVCVAMPLMMLGLPGYQGLIQRLMYLQVFSWMWFRYPGGLSRGER